VFFVAVSVTDEDQVKWNQHRYPTLCW